jgi:uncharacterized repeat protein (TIGR01451 family)
MTQVTVTNTADAGAGSLRDAINLVNLSQVGPNEIDFNIPGGGVKTIAPATALPTIFQPVFINGYSQPGSSPNTQFVGDDAVLHVELNGANAGAKSNGLDISASNVTVRGLAIDGFGGSGINTNTISGLVIAGDFIGTDATGLIARGNGADGILFQGVTNSTVGGLNFADRNVIADNFGNGITLAGSSPSSGNLIEGDYIGVAATGANPLGNGGSGIKILAAGDNTVGGKVSQMRNLISGNALDGIEVIGPMFGVTTIAQNYIGVAANGIAKLANNVDGVSLTDVSGIRGGLGATVGDPSGYSVISGNGNAGVHAVRSRVQIQTNLIGINGTNDLTPGVGNGLYGVLLESDLGSLVTANNISFNGQGAVGQGGIVELGTPAAIFRGNQISQNNGLGIDLGGDGVTPNRPPTSIEDPNRFPNVPVITVATVNDATNALHVEGTFDGTENQATTVEIFVSIAASPSGFGEGRSFVGSVNVTTDGAGHATFSADFQGYSSLTPFVTATATSFATSEFSRAALVKVLASPALTLTVAASPDPVAVADVLTYTITARNDTTTAAPGVTLTDDLPAGLALTDDSVASVRARGGTIAPDGAGGTLVSLPPAFFFQGFSESLVLHATANIAGVLVDHATLIPALPDSPIIASASVTSRSIYTFVVLNNNDSGFGSLRQAILNADANPGVDTISFAVPSNQLTIKPATLLPFVTDPTNIDASTQPGFAGTPIVVLDGSALPSSPSAESDGLVVTAGGTTIRGLVVEDFANNGIVLQALTGSRVAGTDARNNGDTGILIRSSIGNTIGGIATADRVVASANALVGIQINGGSALNLIEGSFIGVDATGRTPLGNGQDGVFIERSVANTVGGTAPGSRNVISANKEVEIQIHGSGSSQTVPATGNVVLGNFIGTDLAGDAAIFTAGTSTRGVNEVGVFVNDAPGNTIGGSTPAARNVIGGEAAGVELLAPGAFANFVAGNYIGIDATGTRAIGNTIGVLVDGASVNAIGGNSANLGNVISGNFQVGVRIDGSSEIQVAGNLIGLDASGEKPLGNALNGVFLNNAQNNTIGGPTAGSGNIIANSGQVGINVGGTNARDNLIVGNFVGVTRGGSVQGNGQDGIFLSDAPTNTIGGTTPGSGNFVAGFSQAGIQIAGRFAVGEIILGNTVRSAGTAIGISAENGAANTIPTHGPGANDVTGGVAGVLSVPGFGPAVAGVSTSGNAQTITAVVIAFNGPLNPRRANDKHAYRIDVLNVHGHRVGGVVIASAMYDGINSVTLTLAGPISSLKAYRVVVSGHGPHAITDTLGRKLDGAGTGGSGSDFTGRFGALTVKAGAIARRSVATFGRVR